MATKAMLFHSAAVHRSSNATSSSCMNTNMNATTTTTNRLSRRMQRVSSLVSVSSSSLSSTRRIRYGASTGALSARAMSSVSGKKDVLIINTPSGGHAVLGYSIAKKLRAEGHGVSILVPCEETSSKMLKPPFTYVPNNNNNNNNNHYHYHFHY